MVRDAVGLQLLTVTNKKCLTALFLNFLLNSVQNIELHELATMALRFQFEIKKKHKEEHGAQKEINIPVQSQSNTFLDFSFAKSSI